MLPILLAALAAPAYAQQQTPGAVFTQYCVPCHNATAKVAGLVLNPAERAAMGRRARERFETVHALRILTPVLARLLESA